MKYQGKIIEYMAMVNDFFRTLNELVPNRTTTGLSFFKRLKLMYYIKIKYPLMRTFIRRIIFNYMKKTINDPELFMSFITESLVVLESYILAHSKFENINDFIKHQFSAIEQKSPITVVMNKANEFTIESCKILLHEVLHENNESKLLHAELDIDFIRYTWGVEWTLYSDEEGTKIERMNTFTILSNGQLYNSLYKIDKKLLENDTLHFKLLAFMISGPLAFLLISILSYEFILLKSE